MEPWNKALLALRMSGKNVNDGRHNLTMFYLACLLALGGWEKPWDVGVVADL